MRFSQKIHYFLLPTIILIGCFFALKILAQGLNISYPTIPGATPPQNIQTPITNLLRYIYVFIISISGLIGTIMFIKAGIKYLTSTGDPVKMKEAKRSLLGSLLGILIIFSAYLILRTINPQLVQFSPILLPSAPDISLETITFQSTATAYFIEIPVGSLITSEFSLSSMYATIAPEECRIFPTDTACEYVKFQGALHGKRLKRIHEVVSTTLPVLQKITTLTGELLEVSKELKDKDKELVKYALECNCFTGCDRPCDFGISKLVNIWNIISVDVLDNPNADIGEILNSLQIDIDDIGVDLLEFLKQFIQDILSGQCVGGCETDPCEDKCTGDPCPHRDEMNNLREDIIPKYYQNDSGDPYPSPIHCKKAELKYLLEAFYAFIDGPNNLVKNEDYKDSSYWHSDKAKEWREILGQCVNDGEISQDEVDQIEDLIDSMAEVENKGTYSPETDPPERDIENNLVQLYSIIKLIEKYKHLLNPYSQEYGSMVFIPRAKMEFIINSAQLKPKISTNVLKLPNPPISPQVLGDPFHPITGMFQFYVTGTSHKIRVADDGFAFYIPSPPSEAAPFLPPLYPPHSFKKNPSKFSLVNYAYAQQQEPFYSPPPSYCAKIVEIPVGKTIDEALKLSIQIWDLLNQTRSNTLQIIDLANMNVELASSTLPQLTEDLIDATSEDKCKKCDEACDSHCLGIEIEGIGIHICYCTGIPCPLGEILQKWMEILLDIQAQEENYKAIKDLVESVEEAFKKLDSQEPIGKDYCCEDEEGNCRQNRDVNQPVDLNQIKEREYTLKEKLIEIQKLLNRAREIVNYDKGKHEGKSAYKILIDQLVDLNLAEPEEYRRVVDEEKYDLQSCRVRYVEYLEAIEEEESKTELLNCKVARGEVEDYLYEAIRDKDPEICSPDPLLDCNYFRPTITRRRLPLNCYCYDPDIDVRFNSYNYNSEWLPKRLGPFGGETTQEIASDLFCCVEPYQKEE